MKKVTIITPPEYEGLVLESLGRARVTQLKPVTGTEYDGLKGDPEEQVDYRQLYKRIYDRYGELLDDLEVEPVTPSVDELRTFSLDPEGRVDTIIEEASALLGKIEASEEDLHVQNNRLVNELQKKMEAEKVALDTAKEKLFKQLENIDKERVSFKEQQTAIKARLGSVQALEPEEFKNCFAVGVVKTEVMPRLIEYLKRYPNTYHRASTISDEESLLFVFGNEASRKWVEALFLVFEIKDIFDVLDSGDLLLVLDPAKRKQAIEKYKTELSEMERRGEEIEEEDTEEKLIRDELRKLEAEYDKKVAALKEEYDKKIKENEEIQSQEIAKFKEEQAAAFGVVAFYINLLHLFQRKSAPVLRSKIISVMQGYTPESMVPKLRETLKNVEGEIGENLFVEVSDLGHDDKNVPTPELDFNPSFLQPAWILTRLRGWPSAQEINPGYISVVIFCFQFGLMFGDIGQGLIFLILGYFISKRFDSGMMKYLGTLFIPMGISAIIFGFMYDSIFLIEHAISHWLHEANIHLPFEYPIMPNPVTETTTLMKLVFAIAALEVIFSLILGAINQIKSGNPIGALGEHGLGMILYVTGFYLTAMHFIQIGMDFMAALGHWSFNLVLAGLALSFLEPIIHSVRHGHGVSIEAIGEGVGGLMMTFVEGLANLFSFLRIAAFALAHTSLAIAAEALTHALHIPGIGLVLMNIIALSFEFVSSSVQSLRLLYYEIMGKFFQGGGIPFRPFRIRRINP